MMTVNKNAFKSVMVLYGDNQISTAKALNISRVALCDKINDRYEFRLSEIKVLCDRWELTPQQVYDIFIEENSNLSYPNDGTNPKSEGGKI